MSENWSTPAIGGVVLLAQGFNTTDKNHYGLVLGAFKIGDTHNRYLLVAPGTSVKPNKNYSSPQTFVVKKSITGLGADTCFMLDRNLILLEEYPSSEFIESRNSLANEKTSKVCDIPDIAALLLKHENETSLNLKALIKSVLDRFGIAESSIKPTKPTTQPFLKLK